ncbi:sugar phosphate isomerase/epimerase [bacterium]|nr:sugar phosphate isomerase/epimerase [bacterium]
MPDVLMHINYFEAGYSLSTLFDEAKFYGYDGVELRGTREGLTPAKYVAQVKKEMARTGLCVVMACPCNLNNPKADERAAAVEQSTDLLKKAAAIGVKLFNTMAGSLTVAGIPYTEFDKHGSGAATWEQWAWAVEGFQQLGAVAEELGVRMAFETHNGYIHDLAKPTAEFLRRIGSPAIGANLDMGNIVLNKNGEPLRDALSILGDKVYYNHLKNIFKPSTGGYIVCGLSDGVIDNRVWAQTLKDTGNRSPICLEAPRQGDRDFFAKADIEYFRWVLEGIGWA